MSPHVASVSSNEIDSCPKKEQTKRIVIRKASMPTNSSFSEKHEEIIVQAPSALHEADIVISKRSKTIPVPTKIGSPPKQRAKERNASVASASNALEQPQEMGLQATALEERVACSRDDGKPNELLVTVTQSPEHPKEMGPPAAVDETEKNASLCTEQTLEEAYVEQHFVCQCTNAPSTKPLDDALASANTNVSENSQVSKDVLCQIAVLFNASRASEPPKSPAIFWRRMKKDFPGVDIGAVRKTLLMQRAIQKRKLRRTERVEKNFPASVLSSMKGLEQISNAKELLTLVEPIYNDWSCWSKSTPVKMDGKWFWKMLRQYVPASLVRDLPKQVQYRRSTARISQLAARGLDRRGNVKQYQRRPRLFKQLKEQNGPSASDDASMK
jgi:hypothetical protein